MGYMLILKNFIFKYFPYIIVLGILLVIVFSAYYKGRADKSDEIELKNSKALIVLMEKINEVENFSRLEAAKALEDTSRIQSKLDVILLKTKGRVVVTQDCKPTAGFADTWNQINGAIKDENSITGTIK